MLDLDLDTVHLQMVAKSASDKNIAWCQKNLFVARNSLTFKTLLQETYLYHSVKTREK